MALGGTTLKIMGYDNQFEESLIIIIYYFINLLIYLYIFYIFKYICYYIFHY